MRLSPYSIRIRPLWIMTLKQRTTNDEAPSLRSSDTHTAAWPLLIAALIYGPPVALVAWMAWRVYQKLRNW